MAPAEKYWWSGTTSQAPVAQLLVQGDGDGDGDDAGRFDTVNIPGVMWMVVRTGGARGIDINTLQMTKTITLL